MSLLDSIFNAQDGLAATINPTGPTDHFHDPGRRPRLEPWQAGKQKATSHDGMCDHCNPQLRFCLLRDDKHGQMVSDCGVVHSSVPVDTEEERRSNMVDKDGDKGADHRRTEDLKDEERRHLARIDAAEVKFNAEVARKINNRLNQCTVWFRFLQDDRPGNFCLTKGEVKTATIALRAACVLWGQEGCDEQDHTGSPVFWAIGLALEMAARRHGARDEFLVPTLALQQQVTLEGLHNYLRLYKSEAVVTEESEFGATKAKGHAAAGQRATNEVKRRHASFVELGNTQGKRTAKMATLSQLLGRSGVWDGDGLSPPVTALRAPALVEARLRSRRCAP